VATNRRRAREIERARYARQQERRALERAKQRRRQRISAVVGSAVAVVAVLVVIALVMHGNNGSATATSSTSDSTSTLPSDSTSTSPSTSTSGSTSAVPTPSSLVGLTAAKCAKPAAGKPGTKQYKTAPTLTFPAGSKVVATLKTTCGDITLDLNAAKAPKTVASIVTLARNGFFDHTKCHRLTDSGIYVLQCGDPTGTGSGGPGYTLPDENLPKGKSTDTVTYAAGTLAMANTGTPHTGGSQFFIVYQDSPLPPTYTVFGQLTPASLKIVREIAKGGVAGKGATDGAPALSVVINSVSVTGAPAGPS
jgi:peptidyl-prolyl cis-trans isomerase B (cyclophilin B)